MNLYSFFNTIGMVMVFLYNSLHYKEKQLILGGVSRSAMERFSMKQQRGIAKVLSSAGFWIGLEIVVVYIAQYCFVGFLNSTFGSIVKTGANYFGLLFCSPVLIAIVCALLKIDYLAQVDLITPAYPLGLVFVKIACYANDCCRGVAWIGDLESPIIIPVQLMESAAALILFVFLLLCKRKLKKGTIFPVYMIGYSILRFFTEFCRCEPDVLWGLKTYQFLCIAGVLIGLLEYLAVRLYSRRKEKNSAFG